MKHLNIGSIIVSLILVIVGLSLVLVPGSSGKYAKYAKGKYIGLSENLPGKYDKDVEGNMVDIVLNNKFNRTYKQKKDSLEKVQQELTRKSDSLLRRRQVKEGKELERQATKLDTVMSVLYSQLQGEMLSTTDEQKQEIIQSIKDTLTMERYYEQLVSNKLGVAVKWSEFEDRKVQQQDKTPFLLGGFALVVVALVVFFYANRKIQMNNLAVAAVIGAVLIALTVVTAIATMSGVNEVVRFDTISKKRDLAVRKKLITMRDAQKKYKKYNDRFAPTFDSLKIWLNTDSVEQRKQIQINDSTTQETITKVPAMEVVFPKKKYPNLNVDSLIYVPHTNGVMFDFQASSVERNGVQVPVFEISTLKKNYLEDIMLDNFDEKTVIKIGDLEKPSYNGNWGE